MTDYYNENDPYAAEWLRNLIREKLLPFGHVDDRSIVDVQPNDVKGHRHCHFFAGIGGWAYATMLSNWPDDLQLWTGSCPCQPFSLAGKQKGMKDDRHLWPEWFRLIRAINPVVVMGEQVPGAIGKGWIDTIQRDLEKEHYTTEFAVLSSAPITRNHDGSRIYFVSALPTYSKRKTRQVKSQRVGLPRQEWPRSAADMQAVINSPMQPGECHPQPIIRLDHDGLSPGVVKERTKCAGNAIVPQVAAEVMLSFLNTISL